MQFIGFLLGLSWVATGLAIIVGGVWAAGCLTREKSRGTFREMLLSPISSLELVGGYVEGILWSLIGWVPLEWAVISVALFAVPAPVIAGYLVFTSGGVLLAISLGLLFSWLSENTTVAAAGTLAAILGCTMLCTVFNAYLGTDIFPAVTNRADLLGMASRAILAPYPWGHGTSLVLWGLFQAAVALVILGFLIACVNWQRTEDKSVLRLLLRLSQ